MQTKVVSFRLPVKEYAALLSEAADKNLDLSDFVLTRLYNSSVIKNSSFDFKLKYQNLIYRLLDAVDTNKNLSFIEGQYGKGFRIVALSPQLVNELKGELKMLK